MGSSRAHGRKDRRTAGSKAKGLLPAAESKLGLVVTVLSMAWIMDLVTGAGLILSFVAVIAASFLFRLLGRQ